MLGITTPTTGLLLVPTNNPVVIAKKPNEIEIKAKKIIDLPVKNNE